ncbi:uncharacterized protein LOC121530381 isoform X1 [Drosophila eugracilis]|uniref:uncharacterized protein LOC121530381 isoform X1 n=2 Tax=Drosophila eugracilis TaxID=29029 RepID=UPI001BDA8BB4|nr:uncharacterized protein LOC121530381 isoform X1 [Drosophila eugracilis]
MSCGKCRGHKEKSVKCLIAALDTVKQHALMMERDSEENARTIENLQARNEKLHKELDLLKDRQEFIIPAGKRRLLSLKMIKDDISPQPQSQDSLNVNIAISSIDLSDEDQEMKEDEIIAETQTNVPSPRKLQLPNRKPNIRNLKKQTSNVWISKPSNNAGVLPKLSLPHKSSNLKQTRLKFKAVQTSTTKNDLMEESSPSLSLKRSWPPRPLVQRTGNVGVLSADDLPTTSSRNITSKSTFEKKSMGTMDVLAEIMKDDDEDCSSALKQFEQDMIDQQKHRLSNRTKVEKATPVVKAVNTEPVSQPEIEVGNESTKLSQDTGKYLMKTKEEDTTDSEEEFPLPFLVKEEPELSAKDRFNIESTKLLQDKYLMETKEKDTTDSEEEFPRPFLVKEEPELSGKDLINFMGSILTVFGQQFKRKCT